MRNLTPHGVTLLLAFATIGAAQCPPNYTPVTTTSVDASGNVVITTKLTCPTVDPPPPPPPPTTTPVTKLFNPAQYNHANTRYVSPNGNDSNDGSQSRPWRTLNKAVNSSPQDTLIRIQPGTYSGTNIYGKSRLTLAGDTQVFSNRPGVGQGGFVFDVRNSQYITFDNLKISSVNGGNSPVFIGGSGIDQDHHITVRNCEILGSNTSTNGIHVYGGDIGPGGSVDLLTFEDNVIHAIPGHKLGWNVNVGPSGISVYHARRLDFSPGPHIIERRNFIYDVAQNHISDGIGQSTVSDGNCIIHDLFNRTGYDQRVDIYDNICVYAGGDSIDIFDGSNPTYIYNNTSYRPGRCRGEAYCNDRGNGSGINVNSARNVHICNNLNLGKGGNGTNKGIAASSGGVIGVADYNLNWATSGNDKPGPHDVNADPQLTAPSTSSVSSADWVPRSGSPVIGKGTTSCNGVTTTDSDYWGRPFWTPHIGAHATPQPAGLETTQNKGNRKKFASPTIKRK